DWFAELDAAPPGPDPFPIPDLGVGRLTARSAAEAERMVDKIIAYDTTSPFDAWRTRVLMAADDEHSPLYGCGSHDAAHVDNSESLAQLGPPDLDIVKLYLTEFTATLGQKPQARAEFIKLWNDGCAVLNYQGHGAPRQLADEVLFLSTDIPALLNGSK